MDETKWLFGWANDPNNGDGIEWSVVILTPGKKLI